MSNFSEGIYEDGVKKGIRKTLLGLMLKGLLSVKDTAEQSGVPEQELSELLAIDQDRIADSLSSQPGSNEPKNIPSAQDLLNVVFYKRWSPAEDVEKILENNFHMPMTEDLRNDLRKMHDLRQSIYEEGLKDGMRKALFDLVAKGLLSVQNASVEAGMTELTFSELLAAK